jgi:hypothetical protein
LERLLQIPQFALEKVHVLELINVLALEVTLALNVKLHLLNLQLQPQHQLLFSLALEHQQQIKLFALEREHVSPLIFANVALDMEDPNVTKNSVLENQKQTQMLAMEMDNVWDQTTVNVNQIM